MWCLFHRLQDCCFSCFCCLPFGGCGHLRGLCNFPDGRDRWWAELSKTLICLTADGWGWVPSLLVVFPVATQHWSLPGLFGGANGRLQEGSCQGVFPRTSAVSVLVPTVSHSHPLTLQETLQHYQGGLVHSPLGSLLLPLSPDAHTTLCVPSKSGVSVSPSPVEVLQSIPTRLQSLILYEFLLPLLDPQVGKPDVGLRAFTPVGGLLWYKCSPVCESPTQQLWDLILL